MTILSLITGGIHLHTSRHPWESKKTRYSVKNISKINNTSPLVSAITTSPPWNQETNMPSKNCLSILMNILNLNEYDSSILYTDCKMKFLVTFNYETDVEKIFIVIYLLVMYVLLYMSFISEITYLFRSASFSFYGVFFQCVL